jgi:CDP-diacylglycerol--serine O-phosphatidyltransferase
MSDYENDAEEQAAGISGGSKKPVLVKGGTRFRDKFHGKTFLIPSFITLVGIFCGFLGTVSAFRGDYIYSCKCIALAILLDGLDGRVARRLNATSPFGREFDSLSDLIAFGMAPAVLVYSWGFNTLADEFGLLVAFLVVVCGATRLARFNITSTGEMSLPGDGQGFQGLPIPGAAAALASIVYCFPAPLESEFAIGMMMFYTALVAGLMVSTIGFFSVKHLKLTEGSLRINVVLIALAVALTWKYSQAMILIGSTAYAMSGAIGYIWGRFFPHSWEKQRSFLGLSS